MERTYKQLALIILIIFLSNTTFSQKAINFNDDGEYISFGGVTSLDVNQITIECWVKLDEAKPGAILAKPGAYYLRINDELKIEAGIYDEATDEDWHTVTGTTQLDINENFHVAFTYNGNILKIYLNGNLESSTFYTGNIDQFLTNGVYAGSQIFIDDYSDYVNVEDDTKIYEHENYSHHNPGTAVQDIDITNDRYHFTGDNDVNDVEDEAISYIRGFTALDYIVEVDGLWSQQEGNAYISKRFNDVSDKYEIAIDPEYNTLGLNKVVNNTWYEIISVAIGAENPINNGEWNTIRSKITSIASTNRIEAWVNGTSYIDENDADLSYNKLAILVHDHDYDNFTYHIYFDNLKVYIPLKGTIDELRVFDMALTQSTLLSWMCKVVDNTHPNWSNLKGYWQFDDGTATDQSDNPNNGVINGASFVDSNVPSGYANNFGTETSPLIETTEVQVDIIWDGDDPGSGAIFNVLQINDYPNNLTNLLSNYPQVYWDIMIDSEDASFLADVNFHYDNIGGITDESELKLFTRSNPGDSWSLVTGTTTNIETNNTDGEGYITANNLSNFSQYIISYSSTSSTQITIDGDFSDWTGFPAYITDVGSDNGSGDVDLTAGYYIYSGNVLYLKTDVVGSYNPIDKTYIIYFDTDRNSSTGFASTWWSMGADYRVAHYSDGSHLYHFIGNTQADDSWGWDKPVSSGHLGSSCEIAVDFSDIGVTSADAIWMQWRAELPGPDAMPAFNADRSSMDAPLPVELSSFTAKAMNNSIKLNWQTATEVNNYGFEVQRLNPPLNPLPGGELKGWVKIGFVDGHGNSNSPKTYSYFDINPTGGSRFSYRLKQIDNDGAYEYSDIVEVEFVPTDFVLYQNYPNPFNPTTRIKYSIPYETNVTIKVFDILGEEIMTLVNEKQEAGIYEVEFSTDGGGSSLVSGIYIYQILAGDFSNTKKMLLMK